MVLKSDVLVLCRHVSCRRDSGRFRLALIHTWIVAPVKLFRYACEQFEMAEYNRHENGLYCDRVRWHRAHHGIVEQVGRVKRIIE
jgi:hypothetical protein